MATEGPSQPPPYTNTKIEQAGNVPHYQVYQPQAGNAPPYQFHQPQVIVVPIGPRKFDRYPMGIRCLFCQSDVITQVVFKSSVYTWVACFCLACVGCSLGCCFIPFCCNSCKSAEHVCPICNRVIGTKDVF